MISVLGASEVKVHDLQDESVERRRRHHGLNYVVVIIE